MKIYQILQIRNHKSIVTQFNIDSIYIVLSPLQTFCCVKTTKFNAVRKETFYSIEFLPNTFEVSFHDFPLGKLLTGNE